MTTRQSTAISISRHAGDLSPSTQRQLEIVRPTFEKLEPAFRPFISVVFDCGDALLAAKASGEIARGEWLPFLKQLGITTQRASEFMRLAKRRKELGDEGFTSVRSSLKLIAKPPHKDDDEDQDQDEHEKPKRKADARMTEKEVENAIVSMTDTIDSILRDWTFKELKVFKTLVEKDRRDDYVRFWDQLCSFNVAPKPKQKKHIRNVEHV
jgi:hypothetical protein